MESLQLLVVSRFAEASQATAEKASALDTLGIDPKQLIAQIIAFGILVFILSKWVFPVLIRAIDERHAAIERSLAAAKEAEARSADAQVAIDKLLHDARKESAAIVATAHKEAAVMVEDAEVKARKKAEHIVSEAKSQLDTEILKAQRELRAETKQLVAAATEAIIGQRLDSKTDEALIESALHEAAK